MSLMLRVTTEGISLLLALKKYFSGNVNNAKGKGLFFYHYMFTYHPSTYIYPVARACGGSQQDSSTEGAVLATMNISYYIEFLNWRLSSGSENVLEKYFATLLKSVEIITMLRVLSVVHIAVVLPTRWLM